MVNSMKVLSVNIRGVIDGIRDLLEPPMSAPGIGLPTVEIWYSQKLAMPGDDSLMNLSLRWKIDLELAGKELQDVWKFCERAGLRMAVRGADKAVEITLTGNFHVIEVTSRPKHLTDKEVTGLRGRVIEIGGPEAGAAATIRPITDRDRTKLKAEIQKRDRKVAR